MSKGFSETDETLNKEIYKDLVKPSTVLMGQVISYIPRTIRLWLGKWEKWIINGEESLRLTYEAIEKKTANIPSDKLCEPEAYVAVPIIYQISYCYESEELREMYSNLLVSSMNVDTKRKVHPGFVDIIKQMTPDEAKLLKYIGENQGIAAMDVHETTDEQNSIYTIRYKNYIDIPQKVVEIKSDIPIYVDNLLRLNLIEIPNEQSIANEEVYRDLEKRIKTSAITSNKVKYIKKVIHITDFGNSFFEVCIGK